MPVYAYGRCLCPSRPWIVSKPLKIRPQLLWSRIGNRAYTQGFEWYYLEWPWTTLNKDLKVTPLFDAEYLRNGTRQKHSYNGILRATYTGPTQGCHFEWPWVTAKYSMTWSVTRPLRQLSFLYYRNLVLRRLTLWLCSESVCPNS